jgi:hypothetical protein
MHLNICSDDRIHAGYDDYGNAIMLKNTAGVNEYESLLDIPSCEHRYRWFKKTWLKEIESNCKVDEYRKGCFRIYSTVMGDVDFFPKSNKVNVHKGNLWINNGIQWINENL